MSLEIDRAITNRTRNREDPSFLLLVGRWVVQRCVERAVAEGPAAVDDRPRPGREPMIMLEAKALAGY